MASGDYDSMFANLPRPRIKGRLPFNPTATQPHLQGPPMSATEIATGGRALTDIAPDIRGMPVAQGITQAQTEAVDRGHLPGAAGMSAGQRTAYAANDPWTDPKVGT